MSADLAAMRDACAWRIEAIGGRWSGGVGALEVVLLQSFPAGGSPDRARLDAQQKVLIGGLLQAAERSKWSALAWGVGVR